MKKLNQNMVVWIFQQELVDIGSKSPIIIAFGNDSYKILKRNFTQYKIYKVSHYYYSAFINIDKFREEFIKLEIELMKDSNK